MPDVLVLAYHTVSPTWSSTLAVHPDAFAAQVDLLVRRGYVGTTVSGAVHDPPAERTVAFTFDDAYATVQRYAHPILAAAGYPGSVFVPVDFPGRPEPMSWPGIEFWSQTPEAGELVCLSWGQLRELQTAGWEVGIHGRSHPRLTELDDATLDDELTESKRRLEEEMDRPCRSLAYPYGDHDDRVVEAARRAGLRTALTTPDVFDCSDALRWPRIGIYGDDSAWSFRMKVSPGVRALRRSSLAAAALPALRTTVHGLRRLRGAS